MRDVRTGLLHHAWDASRKQLWADPRSGCSPHFWGRAMGFFGMATVEVLEYLPPDHAEHRTVVAILRRFAEAMVKVQDRESGLWYQILDQPRRKRNFTETSVSVMGAYVLAKGVRLGYLDRRTVGAARAAYEGVLRDKLVTDDTGQPHIVGISRSVELGGNPYRDGSYDCYVQGATGTDDMLGLAPLLMAGVEIALASGGPAGVE